MLLEKPFGVFNVVPTSAIRPYQKGLFRKFFYFAMMAHMSSVMTENLTDNTLRKYAVSQAGVKRLSQEAEVYRKLTSNPHTATLLNARITPDRADLSLEYIHGISLKDWLGLDGNYEVRPKSWNDAKSKLAQYVIAEMSLLTSGILYRDLNLEHVIFANSEAKIIDLEAAIIESSPGVFILNDMRGTWETMAPEEFSGHGELSPRTATYRVAIIAHLALYGMLPFERDPHSRSNSHRLRINRPLKLAETMPKTERKLFSAALAINPIHRHKDPGQFHAKLEQMHASTIQE